MVEGFGGFPHTRFSKMVAWCVVVAKVLSDVSLLLKVEKDFLIVLRVGGSGVGTNLSHFCSSKVRVRVRV